MNNEINEVPVWIHAWCDMATGMPIGGSPTGSAMAFYPPENYSLRYIQLGMKRYHKRCGGEIVTKFKTRWKDSCSFTKWWDECEKCSKHFNETDYE